LWNLVGEYGETSEVELTADQQQAIRRAAHHVIKKVTKDLEANHYNTAIAASMACLNDLYKLKTDNFGKHNAWQHALESLVACVAPFAPHIAEDLWHQLGHSTSVHRDSWPVYDDQYLVEDMVTVAVQVNGKVRDTITVPAASSQEEVEQRAHAQQKVQTYLDSKQIVKSIYIPGKILSIVVK